MRTTVRPTRHRAAPARQLGGQWTSSAVPSILRPACWWALLVGAPPLAER